jgi:guanylate kinase
MSRLILVGAGGSGKDTARKRFEEKGYSYAVSYTTRPPREGEVNGKDYYFITAEVAKTMIEDDRFYEYVEFNGWLYGTTKHQMQYCDLFIMTPSGLAHVKPDDRAASLVIYFDISEEVRRERLSARNMPGDTLDRRIEADQKDFENFTNFDIRITNPDF